MVSQSDEREPMSLTEMGRLGKEKEQVWLGLGNMVKCSAQIAKFEGYSETQLPWTNLKVEERSAVKIKLWESSA